MVRREDIPGRSCRGSTPRAGAIAAWRKNTASPPRPSAAGRCWRAGTAPTTSGPTPVCGIWRPGCAARRSSGWRRTWTPGRSRS
ncbi:MAG: hypothetical protein ACLR5H_04070 [Oscillospiraceae bacterium]